MADKKNSGTPAWKKQTIIIIGGAAGRNDSVVNKTESNELGDTEFGESTVIKLKHADGCGHIIHTASEVGAISACGQSDGQAEAEPG